MHTVAVTALNSEGRRQVVHMQWGFIPPNAPNPLNVKPCFYVQAEEIDSRAHICEAFSARRGIILPSGDAWEGDGRLAFHHQPFVACRDGRTLATAVIWERWSERGLGLLTFAVVTVPVVSESDTVSNRVPAALEGEMWGKWLGEQPASAEELKNILLSTSLRANAASVAVFKAG
jgi:putative SOS response-associated peptidase YedK